MHRGCTEQPCSQCNLGNGTAQIPALSERAKLHVITHAASVLLHTRLLSAHAVSHLAMSVCFNGRILCRGLYASRVLWSNKDKAQRLACVEQPQQSPAHGDAQTEVRLEQHLSSNGSAACPVNTEQQAHGETRHAAVALDQHLRQQLRAFRPLGFFLQPASVCRGRRWATRAHADGACSTQRNAVISRGLAASMALALGAITCRP